MGPLVVISGTGTEVGKTHTGEAFLLAYAARAPIGSYKPVETGVAPGAPGDDDRRLSARSTFHVKQRHTFEPPISAHRAAEEAGVDVDLGAIEDDVAAARARGALLLELPGGLYSPLTLSTVNATLITKLAPTLHVLLAPNRLGVLHDVLSTLAAYPQVDAILLSPHPSTDLSQGTNATDLRRLGAPCLGLLPHASPEALAAHPLLRELVTRILGTD